MNEQGPGRVYNPLLFNKDLVWSSSDIRGCFSKDKGLTFIYDGPLLRAYDSKGSSVCQYDFTLLKDNIPGVSEANVNIITVTPFSKTQVVIGLEDTEGTGLICLFNVVYCSIIRVIILPNGVTAVESITDRNLSELLHEKLPDGGGLVACGTRQGFVFILDLMLDIELQCKKLDISVRDPGEDVDRITLSQNCLTPAYLLSCTENPEYFCYKAANDKIIHQALLDEVYISCLKFVPQLASLCIGYNFGSFQMWRLDSLVLDYASAIDADALPVSHFTYQEPENDPRSFCYLWLVRCSSLASSVTAGDSMEEYVSGSLANLSLLQLAYDNKSYTQSGSAVLYKDLLQLGYALEHQLAPAADDVVSSWVVSCDALSNCVAVRCTDVDDEDSQNNLEVLPNDTNMAMFAWTVRYTDDTTTSHFAIFDINRWYHAQMPSTVRWSGGWCSYFSQYSFDSIISSESICLDVAIDTHTITCYKCPRMSKQERFLFPSSLAFNVSFLSTHSIVKAEYYGLQRQCIEDVINSGTKAIVNPDQAFQLFLTSGLIPNNTLDSITKRKAVLTTLALHSHVQFILQCFYSWSSGEFSKSCCTVQFLIDWLWERLQQIIYEFDRTCTPLFDWSGLPVDAAIRHSIVSSISQTKNLLTVLHQIHARTDPLLSSQLAACNIEERIDVAEARLEHMKLVWWCVCKGLLPEVREEMTSTSHFTYPYNTLRRNYNKLNSQLLTTNSHHIDGKQAELMVDKLMKALGSSVSTVFRQEGGTDKYPPPNIRALLNVFLEDGSRVDKLSLFAYTIVDLMTVVDEAVSDKLSTHLTGILHSLVQGKDYSQLSALVIALWSLDHKEYQDVLRMFKQPEICIYLTPDLAKKVVITLLEQGEAKAALELVDIIGNRVNLGSSLTIAVYLANRMLREALECARFSNEKEDDLRKVFSMLSAAELSDILCMPLSHGELSLLTENLPQKNMDKLVIHYLQTGNVAEAVSLNMKLNSQPVLGRSSEVKERAMIRDKIVQWYVSLLPAIQRELLRDPNYLQLTDRGNSVRPQARKPGSSFFFLDKDKKPSSISDIVRVMLDVNPPSSQTSSPEGAAYKPFIQSLVPSVQRTSTRAATRTSLKITPFKSVTGLFDSPTVRSPLKRSTLSAATDGPRVKSQKQPEDSSAPLSLSIVKELLRTPLVRRKSPRAAAAASVGPTATPHSILKIRKPYLKESPSTLSPSIKFNIPSKDDLSRTAPKSSSRVHFNVSDSVSDSTAQLSPIVICFDEEEEQAGNISTQELPPSIKESSASVSALTNEDDEIEFNFSAPTPSNLDETQPNPSNRNASEVDMELTRPVISTSADPVPVSPVNQAVKLSVSMQICSPECSKLPDNTSASDATGTLNLSATPVAEKVETTTASGKFQAEVKSPSKSKKSRRSRKMNTSDSLLAVAVPVSKKSASRTDIKTLKCSSGSWNDGNMPPNITLSPEQFKAKSAESLIKESAEKSAQKTSPKERSRRSRGSKSTKLSSAVASTATSAVTTSAVTTSALTTGAVTTGEVTATEVTTGELTASALVLSAITASAVTTNAVTVTSESMTPTTTQVTHTAEVITTLTPDHKAAEPHDAVSPAAEAVEVAAVTEDLDADSSFKSLGSLSDEAKLSGLPLREIREAYMEADNQFGISPVVTLSGADVNSSIITDGAVQFSFTKPSSVSGASKELQVTDNEPKTDSLRPPAPGVPVFYFSPTAPASNSATPLAVLPTEEASSNVEFSFTPLPVASHAKQSRKPVRPINVKMPSGESETESEPPERSTRSRGKIAPYKFVQSEPTDDTEKRTTRSRRVKPINVVIPEGVLGSAANSEASRKTMDETSEKPEETEQSTQAPLTPRRSARIRTAAQQAVTDLPTVPEGSEVKATVRKTRTRKTSTSSVASDMSDAKPPKPGRGRRRKASESSVQLLVEEVEPIENRTRHASVSSAEPESPTKGSKQRRTRASSQSSEQGISATDREANESKLRVTRIKSAASGSARAKKDTKVQLEIDIATTDMDKQSPSKISMKVTSSKTSQSARKPCSARKPTSSTKAKKTAVPESPRLSPIVSPEATVTTRSGRVTRARRKL